MALKDWPAEDYAIGSFIQTNVANKFLGYFQPDPDARILDVGCGDGAYSIKILKLIPKGHLVGIDASDNMLALAREKARRVNNFSIQKSDVLTMRFNDEFDHIVSFWCLQWTNNNIAQAFTNIYQALKPEGSVFTLFPSGDDPFMRSYFATRNSGQFSELDSFEPTLQYSFLENLSERLCKIPFAKIKVNKTPQTIELPDLETFRRFVYGIGFYQGQISPPKIVEINEAMVDWFKNYCQSEFDGKYYFQFSPYWVTAEK